MKRKIIKRKKKKGRLLKPRIKILPRRIITCRYCEHFYRGAIFKNSRKCPVIKKKVSGEHSLACTKFKRAKYIPCDIKIIQRISLEACVNRRKNGLCQRCRQFDKEIEYLVQRRKLKHYVRRLSHKNKNNESILNVKGKKKRRLKITNNERREANIHIGRKMLKDFGKRPWMNNYPEIFQVVNKKRTLKHKINGRKKWQEKERVLIHKTW